MIFGKSGGLVILISLLFHAVSGQRILTLDEAISAARMQSPQLAASGKQQKHDRLLEKAAWNLPDPQFVLESPTGDFMTFGLEQSFEFPTVYVRQKQMAREQTRLSEKSHLISEAALNARIRQLYLHWQFAIAKYQQLKARDSLIAQMAQSAFRQYDAGQIDFVEKSFVELQYTQTSIARMAAQTDMVYALQNIQVYTGLTDTLIPVPFGKAPIDFVMGWPASGSDSPERSPLLAYSRQNESLAMAAVRLEKSKALPDLMIGYFNQAEPSTPFGLRMRFGISVPLWFWQYNANIRAAKTRYEIRQDESDTVLQEWTFQWNDARNDALKSFNTLSDYEQKGLPGAAEMIDASQRMFTAGAYDYIRYLMTVSEAYRVQEQYLDAVYAFNLAIIQIQYLNGQ